MIRLYGISQCDTVRKARQFLQTAGMDFEFIDFRKDGLKPDTIQAWLSSDTIIAYADLINKRSTTWRGLSDAERNEIEKQNLDVLCQHPTLIKRPVLTSPNRILIGFSLDAYQALASTKP
jgi:Spx/MgsR family transcriptional regulator